MWPQSQYHAPGASLYSLMIFLSGHQGPAVLTSFSLLKHSKFISVSVSADSAASA